MARRANYLHYLVNLKKTEMLFNVFKAQWNHPVKDDCTVQVKTDLQDLDIQMTLEEMRKISKNSFKRLVKVKAKEFALDYLLKLKDKHTKMDNLQYLELKLQNYLKDDGISVMEAKNLYRYRTRVANFKENFKNGHQSCAIPCPLCMVQPDSQPHCMQCPIIKSKIDVKGNYSDIFLEDIPAEISKTLLKISEIRENLSQT